MEKKLRLLLFLKMFVGFMLGFLIAYLLELPAAYTAGVIAILHLWYSRETVFKSALLRLAASVIGLSVSALIFFFFGYTLVSLFAMVLIILSILYALKLEYGSTIALVLIGQQWGNQTSNAPLNALYIMLIGTAVALLLNMLTFRKSEILKEKQNALDKEIAAIFQAISEDHLYDFREVRALLLTTEKTLQVALDNYKVANIVESFDYIRMRGEQLKILERIVLSLNALPSSTYKAEIINYLSLFKDRIGREDFASALLVKHDELLNYYRGLELPKTRDEFEHRALLFAILAEIKTFLHLKEEYHQKHHTI